MLGVMENGSILKKLNLHRSRFIIFIVFAGFAFLRYLAQFEFFASSIVTFISLMPFVLIIGFAAWMYLKDKEDHAVYLLMQKNDVFLKNFLKISLAFLILFIVFFPSAWKPVFFLAYPLLQFLTNLSLDDAFIIMSYVGVLTVAGSLIFFFIRLYQKGIGEYQDTVSHLIKKILYTAFAIFFMLFSFSAFAYPQAYAPIGEAGSAIWSNVFDFDASTEQPAITGILGKAIRDTKNNLFKEISSSNSNFSADISNIKKDFSQSIDQASTQLAADVKTKISSTGGTISGDLVINGEIEFDDEQTFNDTTLEEIGFLQGAGSNIQTQLDAKAALIHTHETSDVVGLTEYALLDGRSGGQTLSGGIGSGENLTLQSTSSVNKGMILFGNSGYNEVNDRLGIGATEPDEALELRNGDGGEVGMRIHSANNVEYKIGIADGESILRIVNTNGSGPGDYSEAGIMISSDGHVGIGTSSPEATLTVQAVADEADGGFRVRSSSGMPLFNVYESGADGHLDLYTGDNVSRIHLSSWGDSYFNANGDGKVGIGTTTPTAKLHVYNDYNPAYGDGSYIETKIGSDTGMTINVNDVGDNLNGTALLINHSDPMYSSAVAIRVYETGQILNGNSSGITTGNMIGLSQTTSAFSGDGLRMDFGSGGSFTGDFLDFNNNGSQVFKVTSGGGVVINNVDDNPLRINNTADYDSIQIYDTSSTSGNRMIKLNHSVTANSSSVISANMADGSGSFTGDFLDFNVDSTNKFRVDADGAVWMPTASSLIMGPGQSLYIGDNGTNSYIVTNDSSNRDLSIQTGTDKKVTMDGGLSIGGQATATDGFIHKTNAGACTDALFTTDTDGQICLDSTAGVERMYFRTGGAWSYIAKTGGFQIPNYEVAPIDQLSKNALKGVTQNELTHFQNYLTQQITPGELLIPYADSTLQDGAIHGLYARFADVKDQMFQEEKTQIENLNLQVSGNAVTVAQLQDLVNVQLGAVEKNLATITNGQDTITKQISNINDQISNTETKITNLENLAITLQQQITALQSQIATPVNIAQIDANTQSIDYLNQLLGITPTSKAGDITIVGKLTSQITETGQLTITVNDKDAATIGEATIQAGDTSVTVKTTAVGVDSKIFVTSEKPVEIGVNNIKKAESFKIEISKDLLEDLKINWWIVDEK